MKLSDVLHYYLPYKLKCQLMGEYEDDKETPKEFILSGVDNDPNERGAIFLIDPNVWNYSDVFPILIPLPKLIYKLSEFLYDIRADYFDSAENAKEWLEYAMPQELPFEIVEKIFSLHGDFFGLIPEGLAIEKK